MCDSSQTWGREPSRFFSRWLSSVIHLVLFQDFKQTVRNEIVSTSIVSESQNSWLVTGFVTRPVGVLFVK